MNHRQLIKALIQMNNLNSKEVAFNAGLSPSTLSRFLTGKSDLGSSGFTDLLKVLGVDICDILKDAIVNQSARQGKESVMSELGQVFDTLTSMDQKTVIQLVLSSSPESNSKNLQDKKQMLQSYSQKLAVRKRCSYAI